MFTANTIKFFNSKKEYFLLVLVILTSLGLTACDSAKSAKDDTSKQGIAQDFTGQQQQLPSLHQSLPIQQPLSSLQRRIILNISVDWEGHNTIDPSNLNAMMRFRARFPQFHLQHFLNAAYFTKPNAQPELLQEQIRSVLREGDELGLHLHGWYRLFHLAGVQFLRHNSLRPLTDQDCVIDCGHAVPISDYSVSELRAVLRMSKVILSTYGFGEPTSFRAGAWLASIDVLTALAAEGFTSDSSAVPTRAFNIRNLTDSYPTLIERLVGLWSPQIQSSSQPYLVQTEHGAILEIPNNGLIADWVTVNQMLDTYHAIVHLAGEYPSQTPILSLGFHQESAAVYLPRLEEVLEIIVTLAGRDRILIENPAFPLHLQH